MLQIRAVLFDPDGTLLDRRETFRRHLGRQIGRFGDLFGGRSTAEQVERMVVLDRNGETPRRQFYEQVEADLGLPGAAAARLHDDFEAHFPETCVATPNAHRTLDGLRILEIGGGNLFLASSLRREHAITRYVAIDPAIRMWPEDADVEVRRAYFPCPELASEHFDLVLAHNCLEHIPEALRFLTAIRDALAPSGRAFLTFPDVARQFADGDLNAIVHEHFVYLDEPSARILFARSGFAVAQWESGADLASCLLARATPDEGLSSEATGAAAALLAKGVKGFCMHLPRAVTALAKHLEAGRTVAFYGATNGLNNLLDVTGIGCDVPIMDGDCAKHGRFLPAGQIPIRWVGEAEPAQFERIFVTAGSFQPAIIRALTGTYGVARDRITGLFRRD